MTCGQVDLNCLLTAQWVGHLVGDWWCWDCDIAHYDRYYVLLAGWRKHVYSEWSELAQVARDVDLHGELDLGRRLMLLQITIAPRKMMLAVYPPTKVCPQRLHFYPQCVCTSHKIMGVAFQK